MKILIAANYATPASGNFIASLLELGKKMKAEGDEIVFCFPLASNTSSDKSWTNWLRSEGFQVYLADLNESEQNQLTFLTTIIKQHNIELLHIHFEMFHHLALTYMKQIGVKVLIHDHMEYYPKKKSRQVARCLARSMIYRWRGVGIVSVNREKNSAFLFARHWYLPNGLSLHRNVKHSATREECRAELGLLPQDKMCLLLGWAFQIKGVDIAVKAVEELHKENQQLLIGIIGFGDPPKKKRLDELKKKTGIEPDSPWIRYLPSREDMFAYHRAVDVYLSSSRSEAFSYGLLEAISQNTPVVVSDIKGTSWSKAYSKSVFYPTENYRECAKAIKAALEIGRADSNYLEVMNNYSIDKWCCGLKEIYQEMLNVK